MSDPRDRLSPGQPQSTPGQRGSKRTGEGRWTALASTGSYDSTFRPCGGVRQVGKVRQDKGSCHLCLFTLPVDSPPDHSALPPIWPAGDEAGLCVVHQSFPEGSPG